MRASPPTVWSRNPSAVDFLDDQLAGGATYRQCAARLSDRYGEVVSRGMVARKIAERGRPAMAADRSPVVARGENSHGLFWDRHEGLIPLALEMTLNKTPARAVAQRLSQLAGERVSRNAVIGKLRRIAKANGDPPRPRRDYSIKVEVQRAKRERKKIPHYVKLNARPRLKGDRQAPTAFPERPVPVEARLVPLWDLNGSHCRWIVSGDPSQDPWGVRYCGVAPAYDGCSWCAYHRSVATVPQTAPTARAPRDGRYGR